MSGFAAPNVKVPLLAVVAAGAGVVMGAAALPAVATGVVAVAPNCNVLCVAGAGAAGEPVLAVDGTDQFPKRDLMAGCAAI